MWKVLKHRTTGIRLAQVDLEGLDFSGHRGCRLRGLILVVSFKGISSSNYSLLWELCWFICRKQKGKGVASKRSGEVVGVGLNLPKIGAGAKEGSEFAPHIHTWPCCEL